MNRREQRRLVVLNQVGRGELVGLEAAEVLGLSLRQVRRLLAAYQKEGAAGLAHSNRGRKPCHALEHRLKEQVMGLARTTYAGCNTQHFTELLVEREGVVISRSSVRRILLSRQGSGVPGRGVRQNTAAAGSAIPGRGSYCR